MVSIFRLKKPKLIKDVKLKKQNNNIEVYVGTKRNVHMCMKGPTWGAEAAQKHTACYCTSLHIEKKTNKKKHSD